MNAWVDIDNPSQARCLVPLTRYLQRDGHDVFVTARACGDTFAILRDEGIGFEAVGADPGAGTTRKLQDIKRRSQLLVWYMARQRSSVDFVVTGSSSAALAAHRLGLSSFVITDCEHAGALVYAFSDSSIVYPSLIRAYAFRKWGVRARRLLPFRGLKEDISFSGVDLQSIPAHLPDDGGSVRVLVRPPSEVDFRPEASKLMLAILRYLARSDATVVFSPLDGRQLEYLDRIPRWRRDPIVLDRQLNVVALLKSVDAMVSAGKTIAREAAYLGVPAYCVSRERLGAVDHYLASAGRLAMLRSPADFDRIRLSPKDGLAPLREDSDDVLQEVVEMIFDRLRAA